MDNQKAQPLWEPTNNYPALRRPFVQTEAPDNTNNTNNTFSASDLAKKSTLSVEAKEWYPPGYGTSQATSSPASSKSVQGRLNKYKHTDSSRELEYLYDAIRVLTVKPGKFDSIVGSILEALEPFFEDVEVISQATAAIFYQALAASNFQYSGARLCALLDENCPLLRACLHQLCEKELEHTKNLSTLTLFYAEIYTQLNYELFGKCLLKALKLMLSTPVPENVKYICQTLKLSGSKLDQLDKKLIDKILEQLNSLRPSLPSSMATLVQSVITLRSKQWGMIETQAIPPPAEPSEWSDGPVYYGPDGIQLTSEESEFLAENLNDFMLSDDTDPDALWNPEPEMNEEIQAAFAEFVRSNR